MDVTEVKVLTGWQGDARLYRCDPPYKYKDWDDNEMTTEYVVISAVDNMWAHETYVFASDSAGYCESMTELAGSYHGDTDHERAILNMKQGGE